MALNIDKPIEVSYQLVGGNFATAGEASGNLKVKLTGKYNQACGNSNL
jgi:hypothetical protein